MEKQSFENEYVKFEFDNNILRGTFKKGLVTLDIAKIIVFERRKFSNFKDVPLLICDLGIKSIEREARDYLSSSEGIEGIMASALVTNSALSKHLANFFVNITVIRPKIPTRVFTNESEAIAWLKNYVTENTPA